ASSDAIDTTLAGVAYRAEPSVIALVGTMTPTERPRISSGVDIIANAKRTLHVVDGEVYYDVAGGVLAGTWDTVIEREFAESKTVGSGMLDNAMMPTRPTDWTLLRPDA